MKTRREFIRDSGVIACLTVVASSTNLMACAPGNVEFQFKKCKKGCSRCTNAFKGILDDPTMKARLEALFPNTKKVTVYVRKCSSKTHPNQPSIAMGVCNKALKDKATAYVPGCVKQMKSPYVLKKLEEALKKK